MEDVDRTVTLKVRCLRALTGINWLILGSSGYFNIICGEFLDYPSDYLLVRTTLLHKDTYHNLNQSRIVVRGRMQAQEEERE
jgi:hypothetical protein